MPDGFSWIKSRNLYGILRALKTSESYAEKAMLRKFFYHGVREWIFIFAIFAGLVMFGLTIDGTTSNLIASD